MPRPAFPSPRLRAATLGLLAVALSPVAVSAQSSTCQVPNLTVRYSRGVYSPIDAIAARVMAQADLVRAVGETELSYSQAREIRARAHRLEIGNSVEAVRAYWERRAIGEEEVRKRIGNHLDSQRVRNAKTWERLRDHPDLGQFAVREGTALNFLLHRISAAAPAGLSLNNPAQNPPLPPQVLHDLRLRQNAGGGQFSVFRADEGIALEVDWWPYVFREEAFRRVREGFEAARQKVVADARQKKTLPRESIDGLYVALHAIRLEYDRRYDRSRRISDEFGTRVETWQHHQSAAHFLDRLAGEIRRLQTTGDSTALDGRLKFEGRSLLELVAYMTHNGLDFAPPAPGEEAAYFDLFAKLRDLYITLADDDQGIVPKG